LQLEDCFPSARAFEGAPVMPRGVRWLLKAQFLDEDRFALWHTERSGIFCFNKAEVVLHLTVAHISPIVALVAGILILVAPRLLNYVVAIYLIVVGLVGLNGIYHFVR
jgi:hypothetical protein